MIRRATPLAFALASLLASALFLGVLVDRAELLIAAVPFAVKHAGVIVSQPELRENVLHQILGFAPVAQNAKRDAQHDAAMTLEELSQYFRISGLQALYQDLIRFLVQ